MNFSLAQFLISSTNEYNGHLQHEVNNLPVSDGLNLCRDLEELTGKESSFTLQLWTDGSYTIYQMDKWKHGEHFLGDKDRMILSVNFT